MTFFKQLSNKHSSSAEILETHKLNSAIQHTEIPQRGFEDKRSHHKKDIKATQSFPTQTLITEILQTDILNAEMLHTNNRHTVIECTDI